MTQGKYVDLSVAQRADVWRRWKREVRCIRLGDHKVLHEAEKCSRRAPDSRCTADD